jgi:hypothetical protein
MDKISEYSYDELNPHQELKLYRACLVGDVEGFKIVLDADKQSAIIEFK